MEEFTQSESLCHSPQLGHTPKIQSEDGFASWELEANAIKIPDVSCSSATWSLWITF